jgi:putative endonuclease
MQFLVYILYSPLLDKYYVGFTGDNIAERIRKHKSNHSGYTGRTSDWQLAHSEIYLTKAEAMRREREIKSWKSAERIKKLISG